MAKIYQFPLEDYDIPVNEVYDEEEEMDITELYDKADNYIDDIIADEDLSWGEVIVYFQILQSLIEKFLEANCEPMGE